MIFLLYGPESFLRLKKLKAIEDKYIAEIDPSGQNLLKLEAGKLSFKELHQVLNGRSLFNSKRLIILNNVFVQKDQKLYSFLLDFVESNLGSESDIIVFNEDSDLDKLSSKAKELFASLKLKTPHFQYFKALNNFQVSNFIKQRVSESEIAIDYQALNLLISYTGNDLWRLSNELNKLTAFAKAEKIKIDSKLVELLVSNEFEQKIFNLVDSLVSKNSQHYLSILDEQFLAGLSSEYMLFMFQRQFKIILQIKILLLEGIDKESELASKLKLHPFIIKKAKQQGMSFQLNEVKKWLERLMRLDYNNKQAKIDLKNELYLLSYYF